MKSQSETKIEGQGHMYSDLVYEIVIGPPENFSGIEFVAAHLQISCRTLRRRLSEERTSFRQIINRVRNERALYYLSSSAHTVGEIATILGYTSFGNFCHAFRRWNQETPIEYRRRV